METPAGSRECLECLQEEWDKLGRTDPLWAVLTDRRKAAGGWGLAEFMHTGLDHVEDTFDHLKSLRFAS